MATFSVGQVLSAAEMNAIADAPYAAMGSSGTATFSSGDYSVVPMASIITGYGASVSSNTITVPVAGMYLVPWAFAATLLSSYSANEADWFEAGPYNGSSFYSRVRTYPISTGTGAFIVASGTFLVSLGAGATLQLAVNNELTVNIEQVNDMGLCYLEAIRVGYQ